VLRKYHGTYGHMEILHNYVVPSEESWPGRMWDLPIGNTAGRTRRQRIFTGGPERRQRLEERGFWFDKQDLCNSELDRTWEGSVIPAFTAFRDMHSELNVPQSFVVPSENL
jgi:hypothetical protein